MVRTRLTLRLAQLALLSAAACSAEWHRLGGPFPGDDARDGESGFGAKEPSGSGAMITMGGSNAGGHGGRSAQGGTEETAGNDGGGAAGAGSSAAGSGGDPGGNGGPGEPGGDGSGGMDSPGAGAGGTGGLGGGGTSFGGSSGESGVLLKAIAVAVGQTNTCALLNSKAVRCWGGGSLGQNGYGNLNDIGDNETPASAGDVDVGGPVKQIAVGGAHACALLESGAVRCWGQGRFGKLGYGNTKDIGDDETPASAGNVDVGGNVVQLSLGRDHSCALLDTGAVRCWGDNEHGELGHGNTTVIGDDESPSVAGDAVIGGAAIQVSAGDFTTCALLATGRVRCWGQGFYGELGYANTKDIGDDETPASAGDVDIGGRAVQISVGGNHACALLEQGNVRCWGVGSTGELGYGNTNWIGDNEAPATAGDVNVGGPTAEVAAGTFPTCARLTEGNVRCWGDGQHTGGGLGYGNNNNIGDDETPASAGDVNLGALVTQIAASFDHVCALLTTGRVRCWGSGRYGELGYGNTNAIGDDEVPVSVGDVPLTLPGELVGGGSSGGGADGGSSAGGSSGGGSAGSNGSSGTAGVGGGGNGGFGGSSGFAGLGGSAGGPGSLAVFPNQLTFALHCPTSSGFEPQNVTLKNTGGTALTWTAHENSIYVDVAPISGTLDANAQINLTVVGLGAPFLDSPYAYELPNVTITTDVPGDVAHALAVTNTSDGYRVTPPQTIDFGSVPVGMTVTKTINYSPWWGFAKSPVLASSSPNEFSLSGLVPVNGAWTLSFTPLTPGPKSTTLTIGTQQGCVFAPNTFLATGTGT